MNQLIPEHQSQEQDNLIKATNVGRDLTFAPVQNIIATQIIQSSLETVTQRKLINISPYQGLKRFNFKDRDRFFGRDKLIARLFEAVNKSSLSLVLGASGSGKSSVVRAGLIPELKKSLESQTFYDFIFTPNQNPFDSLYRCLLSEEKDYNFSKSEAEIALEAKAHTLTQVITTLKKDEERWLIFVDQFEELFTICDDPDKRKNFIEGIVQVAKSGNNSVKIVLAMRSDFLEQFSFYPDLGAIANQNNIHLVTEMYPDDLRQAIEQPAARHGVVFEEGLIKQIIEEVEKQKGYLPLLQYTLNLLWENECQTIGASGRPNIEDRTLNKKSYAALEGVRGALQKRVNEIYSNLNQEEQTTTKQIFLKLVNIVDSDSGSRAVSRRAYRDEFVDESEQKTLNTFIDEKLLVTSSEYFSPEELRVSDIKHLRQSATVEIAHEILLSSWDLLKHWLEQEKEAIILKNWLAGETKGWQTIRSEGESRANDELLKGSRLAQVVEFRNKDAFKNLGGLTKQEEEFINASVEYRERLQKAEADRRRREIRTAWGIAGGSLVAVMVSTGLGLMAWNNAKQAEINQANGLGQYSLALFDTHKELDALIQALKAKEILRKQNVTEPVVMSALQTAVYGVRERNRLTGHIDSVKAVAFSPDGKTIATGSKDKTVKLWNLQGQELKTLSGHKFSVNAVAFSPDGKTIATGSKDKTVKLWNLEGQELKTLSGHTDSVTAIAFSPDGKTIATGSADKTVKLWNLEGQELKTLSGHTYEVYAVAFSPDGKTIATGSRDKTVKLWNLEGQELKTLSGHTDSVSAVAFSPDGKTIATGSFDKTVKLWNLLGQELKTLSGHTDSVYAVAFSPDGKTIATGSFDNTVKLWNLEGQELKTLSGHTDSVTAVAFSPDGKIIATGSFDNTVKLWNLESKTLSGHKFSVNAVAFSPDGKTIATGSGDSTVKLWNLEGQELKTLSGHTDSVYAVAFSPDGKTIATGSGDNTVKLWNLEGQELKTLSGHTDSVTAVAFSPDGKTIATGSGDSTVKLWNLEGQELKTLSGHTNWVTAVAFSPDGKTIATGSFDKTVKLWNLEGQELKTLEHTDSVSAVAFSPDGKTIAIGSGDNTVRLWNLQGQELKTLSGHTNWVTAVAFSPDGKTIATGSGDKTVKLWNLEGQELKTLSGHRDSVFAVAFSPDGKTIATGSADTRGILWDLDKVELEPLMVSACNLVHDYLQNSQQVEDSNKHLCDGIGAQK